jgi:hypothetical protein
MIARSSEELEVPMHKLRITPNRPIGLAFDIADLMVLESWSETHNIRMVVELDHCVEDEEYEEVIAFYAKDSPLRRWILWRSATDIVVQRLIGRTCRFGSVAEALDSLPVMRPDRQKRGPRAPKRNESRRRSTGRSVTPCQA